MIEGEVNLCPIKSEEKLRPYRTGKQTSAGKGTGVSRMVREPDSASASERIDEAQGWTRNSRHDYDVRMAHRHGNIGVSFLGDLVGGAGFRPLRDQLLIDRRFEMA